MNTFLQLSIIGGQQLINNRLIYIHKIKKIDVLFIQIICINVSDYHSLVRSLYKYFFPREIKIEISFKKNI